MKKSYFLIPFAAAMVMIVASCHISINNKGVNVISISSKGFDDAPSCKMPLGEFSTIDNSLPVTVDYCRSDKYGLKVMGDTSIVESLQAEVHNGKLLLELEPGVYRDLWLKVVVYAPHISTIHLNGSGTMNCDSITDREARFEVVENGSGDITFKAIDSKDVSLSINGSGVIEASQVLSHAAKLSINGSGTIWVHDLQVEEDLKAIVNGSGDMLINGYASKVKANVNGSGAIAGKLEHQVLESEKMGSGVIDLKKSEKD